MSSTSGSTSWRPLLRSAIRALRSLAARGAPEPEWRMGGGTVLMLRHGHRLSVDIDVFLRDVQLLAFLSPRVNDEVAALATEYAEESASLKLSLPDGELDFIVAPTLLPLPAEPLEFDGQTVLLEPSAEIVAKKAFYRGARLKVRDVVDLALVLEREPRAREPLAALLRPLRATLLRRLTQLEPGFQERLIAEVALLPAGDPLARRSHELVTRFVTSLEP